MTTQPNNKLEAKVGIHKFPLNNTKYFELDEQQNWLKALLTELNEKAQDKTPEEYLENSGLKLNLEITKKHSREFGDYLLVKGEFSANYFTACVRTLEEMTDSLNLSLKACFIATEYENDENFQDQTETFQDNELYELYFYSKNQIDMAEFVHEQIFLNMNQYPVKNADSPLPNSGTQH